MKTITKTDLIDRITARTKLKRAVVKDALQFFFDEVVRELADGNRIEFRDFGVFEARQRGPRMGHNPRTLQRLAVPARRGVRFKVGRLMRAALDEQPAPPFAPAAGPPPDRASNGHDPAVQIKVKAGRSSSAAARE